MNDLPPELLDWILEQCPHSALKNMRLVNHYYHDASTPKVFEHFYMGQFTSCLENLISLSKSPLGKHIKRFTFYSDYFPLWSKDQTREIWNRLIDFRPEFDAWRNGRDLGFECERGDERWRRWEARTIRNNVDEIPRHYFNLQELNEGFEEFERLRADAGVWVTNEYALLFKEHFAMLPNLTEAICAPASFLFPENASRAPVWKRLRRRMLVSPDDWNDAKKHTLAGRRSHRVLPSERVRAQPALCVLEGLGFRASFAGTRQIHKLTVHLEHEISLQKFMLQTHRSTPDSSSLHGKARFNLVKEAFQHLTDLNWRMDGSDLLAARRSKADIEAIELLQSAKQLRRLSLAYGADHDNPPELSLLRLDVQHPLGPLFETPLLWPHLEHLGLSATMPHSSLLRFLACLPPSLCSLELWDMMIEDIMDLLRRIPQMLSLRHINLRELTHFHGETEDELFCHAFKRGLNVEGEYEQAVRAYLLAQSDELPNVRRE